MSLIQIWNDARVAFPGLSSFELPESAVERDAYIARVIATLRRQKALSVQTNIDEMWTETGRARSATRHALRQDIPTLRTLQRLEQRVLRAVREQRRKAA